jgi:hypothetical protein
MRKMERNVQWFSKINIVQRVTTLVNSKGSAGQGSTVQAGQSNTGQDSAV